MNSYNGTNIKNKYLKIKNDVNEFEISLVNYYDEQTIDNLKNNYNDYTSSNIKMKKEFTTLYKEFLTVEKEYNKYLENAPLQTLDEVKLYINSKCTDIDEKISDINDKINNMTEKNIKDKLIDICSKLKQYEKKYDIFIYYHIIYKICNYTNYGILNFEYYVNNIKAFEELKNNNNLLNIIKKILSCEEFLYITKNQDTTNYGKFDFSIKKDKFNISASFNNTINNGFTSNGIIDNVVDEIVTYIKKDIKTLYTLLYNMLYTIYNNIVLFEENDFDIKIFNLVFKNFIIICKNNTRKTIYELLDEYYYKIQKQL
jgi:hypothetical protein